MANLKVLERGRDGWQRVIISRSECETQKSGREVEDGVVKTPAESEVCEERWKIVCVLVEIVAEV
jgi:hypothetical protein